MNLELLAVQLNTELLDSITKRLGSSLSKEMREAFLRHPRHDFLTTFKPKYSDTWFDTTNGWTEKSLTEVFKDQSLAVASSSTLIKSAQSTPSFIIALLNRLNLQSAKKVLEIGSGTAWLLALIASIVGPKGMALGIEILPDLVEQSQKTLLKSGLPWARVVYGDGGDPPVAEKFDRIISTSASGIPRWLADYLKDGGLAAFAIDIPGFGDRTVIFKRKGKQGIGIVSQYSLSVPAAGNLSGIDRNRVRRINWETFKKNHRFIPLSQVLPYEQINFLTHARVGEFILNVLAGAKLFRISTSSGKTVYAAGIHGAKHQDTAFVNGKGIFSRGSTVHEERIVESLEEYGRTRKKGLELTPILDFDKTKDSNILNWRLGPTMPSLLKTE
jgi:protein-L-isoaspartate O-methyltransferase